MAEKSSELDRIDAADEILTSADADRDDLLEVRSDNDDSDNYAAIDTETLEAASDDDEDDDESTDETDEIRAQIVETRSQMGETIDAIQEKLSFQNISEQVKEQVSEHINSAIETAKDTVYGVTIGNLGKAGKFMQNIGKEISKTEAGRFARKNPFPLVLIGLGVGLLAYEGFGSKNRRTYRYSDYDNDPRNRGNRDSGTISTLKSATGKIGDTAGHAYESVTETTGQALESVKGAASSAYGTVTDTANKAYSSVTDYAGTAYEKVGEYGSVAREKYDYYLEENPLAVGAVALAVGAAVGLALPATRYESEFMGEYSSQLLDKAQNAAGDIVDRVKEVAAEAKTTLTDEVKTTLDQTKKTITDEAKNQGFITDEPKDIGFNKPKSPGIV
jgi:ElaB/YqjD/DUF883 family membrane-anchored ribosome-binding protein